VGGILANDSYPADFIYSNLAIQTNVIHAAWQQGVRRLLFLGSSCIYPRECPQPIKEQYLLTGPLENTNRAYAVAKISGIEMCRSYNRQHQTAFLSVMPTNLYGPDDNFDLESSHVLPALIRKFHLGKLASRGEWNEILEDQKIFGRIPASVAGDLAAIGKYCGHDAPADLEDGPGNVMGRFAITLWGTGVPRREFLHVDDLADACVSLMELEDSLFENVLQHPDGPLINIGCGCDSTIKELALLVREAVGFEGDIRFDTTKPDGTPQKLLDVSRLFSLGWGQKIPLKEGIRETYRSYTQKTGYSG
jgi:GDP-L-fucose synthase